MIEITKIGKIPKRESGDVACWSCSSELKYEWEDTVLHYNEVKSAVRVIICPVCSNKIPISK